MRVGLWVLGVVGALLVTSCGGYEVTPFRPLPDAPPRVGETPPAALVDDGPDGYAEWAVLGPDRGVPARALQAYAHAAAVTARDTPECGLGWTTLAGIGSVESDHGRHGESVLQDDGEAVPPIRGALLDGGPGIAEIVDTDDGELDGSAELDRAVGPMQFIPETWVRWGADADGDGRTDPDDLDDAALTAASYLCGRGGDLSTEDGWERAILTYNRSDDYVRDVLRRADAYAGEPAE